MIRVLLEQIARDEVAAFFAEADDSANAAVRMHHLNAEARLATDRGLTDLAREASAHMQRIRPSDLGMQHIRVESSLPKYVAAMTTSEPLRRRRRSRVARRRSCGARPRAVAPVEPEHDGAMDVEAIAAELLEAADNAELIEPTTTKAQVADLGLHASLGGGGRI